jgi:hypothetical protein
MVCAICGKIEVWIAGQLASVALIAALPGTAILDTAEGDRGKSKSSGRTIAGEEDARRRRGEGVRGASESEISSILVHSFRETGWEAEGFGGEVTLRKARGDKAVVAASCRGRSTGRRGILGDTRPVTLAAIGWLKGCAGDDELIETTVCSLRGRPTGRLGEGEGTRWVESFFRGLPTGRFGDLEASLPRLFSSRD